MTGELRRPTVRWLRATFGIAVAAGLVAFSAVDDTPAVHERFTTGTSTVRLDEGEHSLWWQTECRPDVVPELGLFEIDIRTSAGATVDVVDARAAGIEGDRRGLCRYAVGRLELEDADTLAVTLDAAPGIPVGTMVVSAGDAALGQFLPLALIPVALAVAVGLSAVVARRHGVAFGTALRQVVARG